MNKIKMIAIGVFAAAGIAVPTTVASAAPAVSQSAFTGNAARDFIIRHESGGNPYAVNPSSGTTGLYQCMPSVHSCPALGDVAGQHAWGEHYMSSRYGTWENAQAFWLSHNWW